MNDWTQPNLPGMLSIEALVVTEPNVTKVKYSRHDAGHR